MPDSTEQIRKMTCYLRDAGGRPHGADIEHWVEARWILANDADGHSDSADEPFTTKLGNANKHGKKARLDKADRQKEEKEGLSVRLSLASMPSIVHRGAG